MTYGYFYYPISEQSKENLSLLVENLPLDSLYYSPVIDYISGNVLANAHVTIFYGILQHKVRKGQIEQFLEKNCGSIELFPDTLSLQPG